MHAKPSLSQVMSKPVVVVPPHSRVDQVLELSSERGMHHFPIVDRDELVGLVCTCDLREEEPHATVGTLVRRSVVTLSVESSLDDAARVMARHAVGSAVIVDATRVMGIVTREDLFAVDAELAAMLSEGHCAACGTARHLRPSIGGAYLCADCTERAKADDWFDTGEGD